MATNIWWYSTMGPSGAKWSAYILNPLPGNFERHSSEKQRKFPLTMGVLAPGSAHARPSARPPISMSGNLLAHVSAESPSNISPNTSEVVSNVSEPYWNLKKKLTAPPLMLMGGWAEGLAWADPGARTPIGVSGILFFSSSYHRYSNHRRGYHGVSNFCMGEDPHRR